MVLIMRQIQTFQGTGCSAHLFYESKVAEAVSLIIDKTKKRKGFVPSGDLSKDDFRNLDSVRSFIGDILRQIFGLKNLRVLLAWDRRSCVIHLKHFMAILLQSTYKINEWPMQNICYFIQISD